jgi:CubicO group peptidase (beta-lactamase class C family)
VIRFLPLALGAAALAGAAAEAPRRLPRAPGAVSEAIDRAVSAEVPRGFSGAVLVANGGHILLEKGYGSIGGVSMRPDTPFWIASSGKQFTSAAILRCAEKGGLSLTDPLGRFFPEARGSVASITVRQLLSHTSGFDQSYVSEGAPDRATAVSRMLREPLADVPGKKFHYSNTNYQLAVAIVEVVSGRPYRQFVSSELWRRAGLTRTGFAGGPGAGRVAPAASPMPERLRKAGWGGEGVYSTAEDLFAWYRALRQGRVLSPSSVEVLFTPVAPIGEGQTALGWFIGRSPAGTAAIFTRGNEDFGPNSLLYAYPASETVVVVLTHAGDANDDLSWSRFVLRKIEAALGL